jgi:uncharacterized protein (DUF736 family)
MIIGKFIYDPQMDRYGGEIATLTVERSGVEFRPTDKTGDKGPDYRIIEVRDGAIVEIGCRSEAQQR